MGSLPTRGTGLRCHPEEGNPMKNPNSAECIRCGECVKICPKNALSWTAAGKAKKPVIVRVAEN